MNKFKLILLVILPIFSSLLITSHANAFTDSFKSNFPTIFGKNESSTLPTNNNMIKTQYQAGSTPEKTIASYMNATQNLHHHWNSDIYSAKTKEMFRDRRPVTKAQLKNSAKGHKECGGFRIKRSIDDKYTVIYYPAKKRRCNPYFLILEEDNKWRLDMDTMSKAMVMDNKNRWRFRTNYMDHPYMPIFQSFWRTDEYGWPYKPKK
ncbi:MAG: hypothetical protein GY804_07315 [Alphaproteobacteria bacterium]|nr:hypothetical protein [Alphaproteobacteria bacterium]